MLLGGRLGFRLGFGEEGGGRRVVAFVVARRGLAGGPRGNVVVRWAGGCWAISPQAPALFRPVRSLVYTLFFSWESFVCLFLLRREPFSICKNEKMENERKGEPRFYRWGYFGFFATTFIGTLLAKKRLACTLPVGIRHSFVAEEKGN